MQLNNYIQTKFPFFVALSLTFLLASCGSYQYVGYDSDGIYNDNEDVVYEEARTIPVEDQSVYKDYFTEKSIQYSEIPNDGSAIFTDIDSYEGNYNEEPSDEVQTGYAGWGQSTSDVTINVYNRSWAQPWGWNSGFGYGFNNWGYSRFGWNNPYRWNRWGWNTGFGYGWNNWGWNAGYGYGYGYGWNNSFWCPPYYRNNYNRSNSYAYNYGRRGSNLNRNYSRRNSSSNLSRRNSSTIRNNSSVRPRSTNSSVRPRVTTPRRTNSTVRPRVTTPRRTNSTVRPRTTTPRRANSSSVRSRSNTRSSTPRASSSRSSSRSSSSARSSRSSSSRSSGSSRSSSRGSSGRRGN